MFAEFDKWPVVLQVAAMVGIAIAATFTYLRAWKKAPSAIEGSPVAEEFKRIKSDMAMATNALQISLNDQIKEHVEKSEEHWNLVEERLRKVETKVEVLYDRQNRASRR